MGECWAPVNKMAAMHTMGVAQGRKLLRCGIDWQMHGGYELSRSTSFRFSHPETWLPRTFFPSRVRAQTRGLVLTAMPLFLTWTDTTDPRPAPRSSSTLLQCGQRGLRICHWFGLDSNVCASPFHRIGFGCCSRMSGGTLYGMGTGQPRKKTNKTSWKERWSRLQQSLKLQDEVIDPGTPSGINRLGGLLSRCMILHSCNTQVLEWYS